MRTVTSIPNAAEEAERLPLREDFMRALTWLLDERELSQRELAEGLGWSSHTRIQPWRNLKSEPKPSEVFEIERFLKVPPGTLSLHLGYLPPGARSMNSAAAGVEAAIEADPMLPDWGKRLLAANYREIRNNYVHGAQRRRRAPS